MALSSYITSPLNCVLQQCLLFCYASWLCMVINIIAQYNEWWASPRHYTVDPRLLPSGNPFKCHEENLCLQPMIPPKRFDIFPPGWGVLRRSRRVQSFALESDRKLRFSDKKERMNESASYRTTQQIGVLCKYFMTTDSSWCCTVNPMFKNSTRYKTA